MLSNKQKGDIYELYIKDYIEKNNIDKQCYLWYKIPDCELRKVGLLGDWQLHRLNKKEAHLENNICDFGVDILVKDKNENYELVQCKNYENNSITVECLAGFTMCLLLSGKKGYVYYTSKMSKNLRELKKIDNLEYIHKPLDKDFLNKIAEVYVNESKKSIIYSNLLESPYEYQVIAYKNIMKNFDSGMKRCTLQMPCGLGKTLTSMLVACHHKQIVIVSPLQQYCYQNLQRFKSELKFKDYNSLLIDSDGTRDINVVNKFVLKNKKFILSICFKSCDILFEILGNLSDYIIIFDEFHHISRNDILCMNENKIGELLQTDSKILFMSATPRLFDENIDEESIEDNTLLSPFFGEIEYSYNMGTAIKDKRLCNYEVYIPDISLDNTPFTNDIIEELNLKDMDNKLLTKTNFFMRGILEKGSRKIILFTKSHIEANLYKDLIIKLQDYYIEKINVETILCNDSYESREIKIKNFRTCDDISILINVQILGECFDEQSCDTVIFANKTSSKIGAIQKMSRATRIDPKNPHKIAKIFIWANEYDDLTDMIANLKEFDNSFCNETVKIMTISNTNLLVLERENNAKKYNLLDFHILNIKLASTWIDKFNKLLDYIEVHKQAPSRYSKIPEINFLGQFFQSQNYIYKKKMKMMKNEKFYNIWTKLKTDYPKLFLNHSQKWIEKLNLLKDFIDTNKRKPMPNKSEQDNEDLESEIKSDDNDSDDEFEEENIISESDLNKWLKSQNQNFKNKRKIFSGNYLEINQLWTEFNNEYAKYHIEQKSSWLAFFNELRDFLVQNGKLPTQVSAPKIHNFYAKQLKNVKDNCKTSLIFENPDYMKLWNQFTKDFQHIMNPENNWYDNLNKVKEFIKTNSKAPNKRSNNIDEKNIGEWLSHQKINLRSNKYSMCDLKYNKSTRKHDIPNLEKSIFIEFMNEYKQFI